MGAVASTPLQGTGTQEQAWLRCQWLWQHPAISAATLLAGHERVVVVAPHPDDEILGCGGLLGHAAGQGMQVRVVAVTDGEACYPHERWWTPERLRSARRAELAQRWASSASRPAPRSTLALPTARSVRTNKAWRTGCNSTCSRATWYWHPGASMGTPTTKRQAVLPAGPRVRWLPAPGVSSVGLALAGPGLCAHGPGGARTARHHRRRGRQAQRDRPLPHPDRRSAETAQPTSAASPCIDPILPEPRGFPGMSAQPYFDELHEQEDPSATAADGMRSASERCCWPA